LNIKAQHAIKSNFDIYVKDTLICFSNLETNQLLSYKYSIRINFHYKQIWTLKHNMI